jgi:hypothetical protein
LADRVAHAAAAADWLGATDEAAVDLAVYLARMLEAAEPDDDGRAVAPIAATLARLLTDLGLTHKGRPTAPTAEGVTWLDELRKPGTSAKGRNARP